MTENNIFLLDSNILIDNCWDGKEKLALSTQNLSEFFSITTTKKFLDKKDSIRIISDIIKFPGFVKIIFDHETVLEAAKISDEYKMSYWDSLLAATMKRTGYRSEEHTSELQSQF